MNNLPIVYLKSQEDRRIKLGHLWIYSNEVDIKKSPLKNFTKGELVTVKNNRDENLGIGYINPNNLLCIRLLSRDSNEIIDDNFFKQHFSQALKLRQEIFPKPFYRLIYGEGDFLPGLIIDRFGDYFVIQITTAGMEKFKDNIINVIQSEFKPQGIILRNDSNARKIEDLDLYVNIAFGDVPEFISVQENNAEFLIPSKTGQKTGWFYDHRDNRARLQRYVKNKKVLDVFSYVGAWGIQAALMGAKKVLCVDSSEKAIEQLQKNAELNKVADKVSVMNADAFEALKQLRQKNEKFDIIILDPPAFIKKRKDIKNGVLAYQRLNEMALQLLNPNGILVSCSCSLHLDRGTFIDILNRSAVKTQRQLQIIEEGHQAPDHPIHPAIPETAYLKCFICRVL